MNVDQAFNNNVFSQHLFTKKDKLLLAVSGGVDSVVLCELCKLYGYEFSIAHCNFQLRGQESDRDADFVKSLAAKYEVPFHLAVFNTKAVAAAKKKSIEETARDLRYTWFQQLVDNEKLDWIVTAHHADDNIETVAMNFFRGTGIKGLRGILPKKGKLVRPMLTFRKKELEEFAAARQLEYVTDHTNFENDYTRNYFRNKLIPLIKEAYPATEQNLLHNIRRFAETEELFDQAIALHKKQLLEQKQNEVHIPVLKLSKVKPLRTIVYEIIAAYNFNAAQTDEVIGLLDSESSRYVTSSTHRIIRNRAWLIISPLETAQAAHILLEDGANKIKFAHGNLAVKQSATVKHNLPADKHMACLDRKGIIFPLILRPWKAGDYFYPLGMRKKKKVARFLIDQKLSKTEKEKVWVLESNKRIVWVVGLRIDERFKITESTKENITITFQIE